jgi:transposase InsO family protein
MCRVLEVSTSGYYAWLGRFPSRRAREDVRIRERIEAIHAWSRGTYGAPRIHAELAAEGIRVSRKRVARLMREAGLEGASRRRRRGTTKRNPEAEPAPDLVEREFTAPAPDRLWVADSKYIPTGEGVLHLAAVVVNADVEFPKIADLKFPTPAPFSLSRQH